MRQGMRKSLVVWLVVVFGGGALTGCIQDPTCSPAGRSRMNAAIVELLQTSPGQVGYLSTPDCESGDRLSTTLELQISWEELMSRLSDRCRAEAEEAACRLGGEEFTVYLHSELESGVEVTIFEAE